MPITWSAIPRGPGPWTPGSGPPRSAGLLGDWQGSLRRYQGILSRQPQPEVALKARYGIGRAYFKLGEYQQASQVLDNLTAAPDLPRSLWFSTQALMAEIALKQGQVPQAFARLRLAAQDLASGDPEWFEDLKTRLLEQATVPELEQLAALYRDNPLSAALLLRLARLAQDSGQTEEARKMGGHPQRAFSQQPRSRRGRTAPGREQSGGGLPPALERPVELHRLPGAARHGAGGQKGLGETGVPGHRHGPGDRGRPHPGTGPG